MRVHVGEPRDDKLPRAVDDVSGRFMAAAALTRGRWQHVAFEVQDGHGTGSSAGLHFLAETTLDQSDLMATMGLTRVARSAGAIVATSAVTASTTGTVKNVATSRASTP